MENLENSTITFADANVSVWNSLGTVINNINDSEEAIKKAKLDFIVEKLPLYVNIDNKYKAVESSFATVRADTQDILGNVGDTYGILQNTEAFKCLLDPILQSNDATIQSVGYMGNGERVFISARLNNPIILVGNDVIEQDLLVITSHDGKSGTSVIYTPTRVKSQTTLNGEFDPNLPSRKSQKHTANQITRYQLGSNILKPYTEYRNRLEDIFNTLAETKISEADYEKIIVKGLSDNVGMVNNYFDPNGKQSTRFTNNVQSVLQYAYTHSTQLTESTNMTLFGAYNAVVGWYQNELDWKGDLDAKMRSMIDTNGRVNLKQQQTFEAVLNF